MKTKNLLTALILVLMLYSAAASAQLPVLEKSYDISRKAKNGYLGGIYIDSAKGTFDMVYVLRSSARKVKREIYTFDKELNLLNTVKDEEEVDRQRGKHHRQPDLQAGSQNRDKEVTPKLEWVTGREVY